MAVHSWPLSSFHQLFSWTALVLAFLTHVSQIYQKICETETKLNWMRWFMDKNEKWKWFSFAPNKPSPSSTRFILLFSDIVSDPTQFQDSFEIPSTAKLSSVPVHVVFKTDCEWDFTLSIHSHSHISYKLSIHS